MISLLSPSISQPLSTFFSSRPPDFYVLGKPRNLGSVNESNAEHYAALPDVDGFVVGRAGLDVEKLSAICRTLVSCKSGSRA